MTCCNTYQPHCLQQAGLWCFYFEIETGSVVFRARAALAETLRPVVFDGKLSSDVQVELRVQSRRAALLHLRLLLHEQPLHSPPEPRCPCLPARARSRITTVKMPFIEPLSDVHLERLASERVVPALLSRGFFYVDGLLGDVAGDAVLEQVQDLHRSGALQDGRLAGSVSGIHQRSIRGDKIAWVSGAERGCEAINFLLNLIDKLVSVCARRLGGKTIRERSKVILGSLVQVQTEDRMRVR